MWRHTRIKKESVEHILKESPDLTYRITSDEDAVFIKKDGLTLIRVNTLRELVVFEYAWRIRGGFDE